ncbi:MAG: hypothetical protein COT84_08245 [Chlamydiae bacterium CG10_big_fil_rev_8_21_14_0_10_35_9]|nr:MAG: hypothetical protein COT84_08245 [Chlamydiae bacterium CG10_big_fil_rev_8_21_14_0_10_35_9]
MSAKNNIDSFSNILSTSNSPVEKSEEELSPSQKLHQLINRNDKDINPSQNLPKNPWDISSSNKDLQETDEDCPDSLFLTEREINYLIDLIDNSDSSISLEDLLQAKADLIPQEYEKLSSLAKELKLNPESELIHNFLEQIQRQIDDAKRCRSIAENQKPIKDYNLNKVVIDIFLDKERALDNAIRNKGNDISYNTKTNNIARKLYNRLIEAKSSNQSNKNLISELDEATSQEIRGLLNDLGKRKIKNCHSSPQMGSDSAIELPDTDDINVLLDRVSSCMDELRTSNQLYFTSLQTEFTDKMACFETVKQTLNRYSDAIRRMVQNQRT